MDALKLLYFYVSAGRYEDFDTLKIVLIPNGKSVDRQTALSQLGLDHLLGLELVVAAAHRIIPTNFSNR